MVAIAPLPPRSFPFRRWVVAATVATALVVAPTVVAAPGDLSSYAVPSGNVQGIAVAADGHVWFVLRDAGVLGRLDPSTGAVSEWALDPASGPTSVTVGADGSVWFTLQDGNAIGRLLPGGDLVGYALPNEASGPAGIAATADGSVWFTERFGNRLGRIDPAGTISEWPTGTLGGPQGIAVEDDGTVWFSAQQASKLGSFDPATGTFAAVDLPATSQPSGVAIGADGDVWVTLRRTSGVSRFDVETSDLSTVALSPGGTPSTAVAGPDGGIWVAETGVGVLTRIDPETGHVASIDLGPTAPSTVASDPSGYVWVSEPMANRVSSVEVEIWTPPADAIAPTVDLRSPVDGSWTAPGVPLTADYACADEGGSGLASCVAPVASGEPITSLEAGAHTFTVDAADGAGNTSSGNATYLAFTSVGGTALGGSARGGAGLTLSLGMALPPKADPGIVATSAPVDCGTGNPIGPSEPAELRDRVANRGSLEVRWLTSRAWDGTCRALTVAFAADGWSGGSATFGAVTFGGAAAAKR
ncbi:MAG TPA: hypothetical protein VLA82_06945 [Actinomycetota bacterium]|nr:hypothetical protein [Actinomycetota bacterium]